MIELSKFVDLIGIDRAQFHYLFAFGRDGHSQTLVLQTEYPETPLGQSRYLTRENCLELAFITHVTNAGAKVVDGVRFAELWLKREKAGSLDKWCCWRGGSHYIGTLKYFAGSTSLDEVAKQMARGGNKMGNVVEDAVTSEPEASDIIPINLHEIVRFVDAILKKEEKRRLAESKNEHDKNERAKAPVIAKSKAQLKAKKATKKKNRK